MSSFSWQRSLGELNYFPILFLKSLPSYLSPKDKKIRSCFFKADESKMANCVSDSAAAQHVETQINGNNNHPDNQSGFYC